MPKIFYCFIALFLMIPALDANTSNGMSFWAENESSQTMQHKDNSQFSPNLIQEQALIDPSGSRTAGVIA